MKTVTIWHQAEPAFADDQPAARMVKAASFQTDLPTGEALAEAFRLTNDDGSTPWEANTALTVEPGERRSTSLGDVVAIDGEAYQCRRDGWKRLTRFEPR